MFQGFGEEFSHSVFIGVFKYKVVDRENVCLLNWYSKACNVENKELEIGSTDAGIMLKSVVKERIQI